MPIDISNVDWLFVGLMAVFAFVAALLGSLIAFRNRFAGAIIAGILFAVIFVFWMICLPFWAVIVVGVTRLLPHRLPPGAARIECGPSGKLVTKLLIGASGTDSNLE